MSVSERQVAAEIERLSGQDVRETRLRLALGAARMGTWERDLITGKDIWSAQQQELFGLKPGSFADTHAAFLRLVHPDDRAGLEDSLRRALAGEEYHSEYRIILPDGAVRWMAGSGDVIRDSDGKPTHMVGITMDITVRKRVEEERARVLEAEKAARQAAENADKAKDAFLATISHELRTPLTAILGWAQLLQRETCNPDELARGLATIERSARSMSQLVEDVLDVSRIITGKLWLRSEAVELGAVIDAAIESVRPIAQAKSIQLHRQLAREPLIVTGDPGRLQQVVWNLLTNALKFTPAQGTVTVELAGAGSQARIIVSDTGEGIAPDFIPHLFERFTQADNTSRRPHAGLGLGLAIVHQLVALHHGSVWAESPGPGKGATFTVELPLAADAISETFRTPTAPVKAASLLINGTLEGLEILVVDDDADALEFIGRTLAGCGAHILTARSAAEAIGCFENRRPALLISDIGMPGEDGYDLIRKVRDCERSRGWPAVPACALTAFAREEDRARAMQSGYQLHVAKPFEPANLAAAVAQLAATRSRRPTDS